MLRYIIKRLLALIPIILIMSMIVFGLTELASGDPARILAEMTYEHPTNEQVEWARHEYGLDQPIYKQYINWAGKALHGDFGFSYNTRRSALEEIGIKLPITIKLAVTSVIILLVIGVPLGILSAVFENKWLDRIIQIFSFFDVSMPGFWIGLMMLYIFGVKLKVISILGSATAAAPVLAAIAMDIGHFGIIIRLIRTNLIEVLHKGYIRTAKAKGLSSFSVIVKHGLKNTILPVLTRFSSMCVSLLCGSAVIESIFAIQGVGNLALVSVQIKDLPVLQCYILLITVFVVVMNLFVDILYSFIDARIQIM